MNTDDTIYTYTLQHIEDHLDARTGEINVEALTDAIALHFDELEPDAFQCCDEIEFIPTARVADIVLDAVQHYTEDLCE